MTKIPTETRKAMILWTLQHDGDIDDGNAWDVLWNRLAGRGADLNKATRADLRNTVTGLLKNGTLIGEKGEKGRLQSLHANADMSVDVFEDPFVQKKTRRTKKPKLVVEAEVQNDVSIDDLESSNHQFSDDRIEAGLVEDMRQGLLQLPISARLELITVLGESVRTDLNDVKGVL